MVVLPAPVGPTRAMVWPGLARQADVHEHRLLRVVAEGHPLKGYRALDVLYRQGSGRIDHRRGRIQHLKDALRTGQGRLQAVVQHGDAAHGPEKVHDIDHKGGDDAHGGQPLQCQPAAQQGRGRDGDRAHGREHRSQRGGDDIRLDARSAIGGIRPLELGDRILGAGKGLDHADSGEILLHHGVQRAQVALHFTESDAAAAGDQRW